jgi:hypothetical protein
VYYRHKNDSEHNKSKVMLHGGDVSEEKAGTHKQKCPQQRSADVVERELPVLH